MYFEVYDPLHGQKLNNYPGLIEVSIRLAMYQTGPKGEIKVGATCATDEEVDFRIRMLKKELDAVGTAAKRKLKKNRDRQLRSLRALRS